MALESPDPAHMDENEFLDYLNHVLLDYDDERCQAHLRKMLPQKETDRPEEQMD